MANQIVIYTDPGEWGISHHAMDRIIRRFGHVTEPAFRALLASADGWTHLSGSLDTRASTAIMESSDIPGIRFVIGWMNSRRHTIITVLKDGHSDPMPMVNHTTDVKRYRRPSGASSHGRTLQADYLRLRRQQVEDE